MSGMQRIIYLDAYMVVGSDPEPDNNAAPWACTEVHTDEEAAHHYLDRCKKNHPEYNYKVVRQFAVMTVGGVAV